VSHDALVVGSGPNGLAAAIELARSGLDVLVLEAGERPGGAVATEELTLPGFRHDTFSSVYPAGTASPVFAAMGLERHGLRWIHPAACMAHPLPDGTAVALYRDLDRTAASLDALHPGDGERWRTFAAPFVAHFDALRDTMLGGFPPLRGPLRLTAGIGPRGMLDFARLLATGAQAFGERLFAGEGSRAWLYGSAMHSDVPPAGRGSAIAAAYMNLLGHGAGWPSPEGGAGRLAAALVSRLGELGGAVRTGARVTRLAVERGRVVGVELGGGERVGAPLVIADVMPGALAALAGDALPSRYARALGRYEIGPATLKLDWALDGPIPWLAEQAREAGTVHVGGSAAEVLRATARGGGNGGGGGRRGGDGGGRGGGGHGDDGGGGLPERPFMLLGQQSLADPTRAPEGKHTAWAYTHGLHSVDWGAERERHVERMEAQIERFAPGFRERILARHVLGPADLEARNANLVGGDVGGGSYALRQVIFRPLPSPAPYRTPVRGLYIGSAATFPGGGVHGVPGHAAARLALAEARVVGLAKRVGRG
jgi:phytoene dehydrogenase-like protein